MTSQPSPSANPVSRWILIGVIPLFTLLLTILVLQIRGVCLHYPYYIVTGVGESTSAYAIWEVQHKIPLYQWPMRDYFQVTFYNFGFYDTYAWILSLLNVRDAEIMLYGRLITVAFSLCGAVVQRQLIKSIFDRTLTGIENAGLWLLCFCTWFNTCMPGYYDFSIRPDFPAVMFCTLALYFFVAYVRTEKGWWLLPAVVAWVLGWCFKQTAIFGLIGVGCYLLAVGRWKPLAFLVVGYGLATGAILLSSSPEYRWNLLTAPQMEPYSFPGTLRNLPMGVALSLFSWSIFVTLPLLLWIEWNDTPLGFRGMLARIRPGGDLSALAVLAFVVAVGTPLGAVSLVRKGSSLNHLFEVYILASSLSFIVFIRLGQLRERLNTRLLGYVACALLLSMCLFPIAQVAMKRMGPIQRATADDLAEKQKFARFLQDQPKPLLITDEMWSMPWFAGTGHEQVVKLDYLWFGDATNKGVIEEGGIEGLIRKHWYGSLYVKKDSSFYRVGLENGYQSVPIAADLTQYKDCLGNPISDGVLLHLTKQP